MTGVRLVPRSARHLLTEEQRRSLRIDLHGKGAEIVWDEKCLL